MQLIRCDACRSEAKEGEAWSKFFTSFDGTQSAVLDLCPDCRARLEAAIGAVILATGEPLTPAKLESIEMVVERHILAVLTATDWNKSRASQILGIERSTLDRKLKSYRATRPSKATSAMPAEDSSSE